MKKYAIGTPVGILNESTARYFYLNGQLLSMDVLPFRVWTQFLHGRDEKTVLLNKKLLTRMSAERIDETVAVLTGAEMLVDFAHLLEHVPQRQGYGVGYNPNTEDCVLYLNGEVHISVSAYLLWSYCDGRTSLNDAVKRMPLEVMRDRSPERIQRIVDELLLSNLILFVS